MKITTIEDLFEKYPSMGIFDQNQHQTERSYFINCKNARCLKGVLEVFETNINKGAGDFFWVAKAFLCWNARGNLNKILKIFQYVDDKSGQSFDWIAYSLKNYAIEEKLESILKVFKEIENRSGGDFCHICIAFCKFNAEANLEQILQECTKNENWNGFWKSRNNPWRNGIKILCLCKS